MKKFLLMSITIITLASTTVSVNAATQETEDKNKFESVFDIFSKVEEKSKEAWEGTKEFYYENDLDQSVEDLYNDTKEAFHKFNQGLKEEYPEEYKNAEEGKEAIKENVNKTIDEVKKEKEEFDKQNPEKKEQEEKVKESSKGIFDSFKIFFKDVKSYFFD